MVRVRERQEAFRMATREDARAHEHTWSINVQALYQCKPRARTANAYADMHCRVREPAYTEL